MYRFVLFFLLSLACAGCMLPADGSQELDVGERDQALYNGSVVGSQLSGSLLSRIVPIYEMYPGGGGASTDCTGVFLSSRWLLTAAHCVENAAAGHAFVFVGAPGTTRRVIVNPGFYRNPSDAAANSEMMAANVADIALIEIDTPLSPYVAPPLPIYPRDLPAGTPLRCYGYGVSYLGAPASDFGTLRSADLRVGQLTYAGDDTLSPRVGFTVVPSGNQAIAPGDSGGPCIYNDGRTEWLVGIHSSNTLWDGSVHSTDEVAAWIYAAWMKYNGYVNNEITGLRVIHGDNLNKPTDVTQQPGSSLATTPFWQCQGRDVCNYPLDWLGSAYTNGGGDVVFSWRCGLESRVRSVRAPAPLAGKIVTVSCPLPGATGASIQIASATYGGNCGAPSGNQSLNLAAACGGRVSCAYRIDYTAIGDPAPGCAKTYDVQYSCGNGSLRTVTAPAEAGFGSQISLSCLRTIPIIRF